MRKITIKQVEALSFKNHVLFTQAFGSLNKIVGENGQGKSSIGEMITWCLGGVDMLGSKLDPTPTDRETAHTGVSVLLEVDEKEIKFSRELVNGKSAFYINDIPKKATEYNQLIDSITGDKTFDMFLSLFNPSYFPTMHWSEQRNMLFSYVSPPPLSEVLKKLPKLQADKLKESFKKVNVDDLEAFHKKNKTNKEKEVIAAKSRVQTLEGQLQGVAVENLEKLVEELTRVCKDIETAQNERVEFTKAKTAIMYKEQGLKTSYHAIEQIKAEHAKVKGVDNCLSCGQSLNEETKKGTLSGLNDRYKEAVSKYKELKLEFDTLEVPPSPDLDKLDQLIIRKSQLERDISAENNRLKAVETIEEAKKAHEDVQASLNESIFLLDAIKAFRAEEATQQAEKVKSLFTGVQLVLEDHLGKPFFTIAMNGKPYNKLSLGEKARAGLELIEVLTQQSEIHAPVFVDNRESITCDIHTSHQLIEAYAVPNQELVIKTDINTNSIIVDCEVL